MRLSRLAVHACPACGHEPLTLRDAPSDDAEIESGTIDCGGCAASYPIVRGLPRFVPASNYADSFGFQWNKHARTQLDSHSRLPISRDRVLAAIGPATDLRGRRVLEAGSGAGRFTEVLVRSGADVVSFDYSSAVDANAANQGRPPSLHLFQGDIFHIPLAGPGFDTVLCLGVIQHTPGGQLAIDVYRLSAAALLQWKYLLRPLTRRMRKESLYRLIERVTPPLVPLARGLRRAAGRAGARLVPIVEYSHLGLEPALNVQWAILDTFDMYSPEHDHPQTLRTVRHWFEQAGFVAIDVRHGPNGVVGVGTRGAA
jgi:SAM-dependent methyltransferase